MARKAEFSINGLGVMAELKKVDRKKIYGWSTIEVFDQNAVILICQIFELHHQLRTLLLKTSSFFKEIFLLDTSFMNLHLKYEVLLAA